MLRRSPLFAGLDDQASHDLLAVMTPMRLERGDILFHEGEAGERLYVITEGKVKDFQKASSITQTGVVATLTWTALDRRDGR